MMAQREWPLGSDPAGAGTAMITSGAMPAPLPAHIGMSQINPITASKDFADPLRAQRRPCRRGLHYRRLLPARRELRECRPLLGP